MSEKRDSDPTESADTAQRMAMIDRIMARVVARLEAAGNPLMDDDVIRAQFFTQAQSVLVRALESPAEDISAFPAPEESGTQMGVVRARQQIHPRDSLQAAAILFDEAAVVVGEDGDPDVTSAARALNASIMSTLVPASTSYVNVLLERLAIAHAEERRRISRDVHDRIAHGIATAIQHVRHNMPSASTEQTVVLLGILEKLMAETGEIAIDLRHTVDEDLDLAVRDYVANIHPTTPTVEVVTFGTPAMLPAGVQEEAFMVVREAIRNAQRHANASRIDVTLTWAERGLQIDVSDDGDGYRREQIRSGALGLTAARERAELIGADLQIETQEGRGTVISLNVPSRPRLP